MRRECSNVTTFSNVDNSFSVCNSYNLRQTKQIQKNGREVNNMILRKLLVECLKLVALDSKELVEENLETYKSSDEYASYINNSISAINRALVRASQEFLLKGKSVAITSSTDYESNSNESVTFSISGLTSDCYAVKEVINTITGGKVDFEVNGDNLIIYKDNAYKPNCFVRTSTGDVPLENVVGNYTLYYAPTPTFITNQTSLETDLLTQGISDSLASMIPFYVESEVLRDDEPSRAIQSFNKFESYMQQFKKEKTKTTQRTVKNVFNW